MIYLSTVPHPLTYLNSYAADQAHSSSGQLVNVNENIIHLRSV